MKRTIQIKLARDEDGIYAYGGGGVSLCLSGLRDRFDFPAGAKCLWLVATDTNRPDSVQVRKCTCGDDSCFLYDGGGLVTLSGRARATVNACGNTAYVTLEYEE
jgi:hypothetical protein